MEPNDLPIVCLPLELSDEAAAQLLDFLYQLAEALERHYAGQLLRYAHDQAPSPPPPPPDSDPPF
jgi:alkanesulfonate monooxygenase SsuD/methylene tetrahydromethanopterin reductase-like flavin-dependent oxidoreductase (luciferase family)